MPKHYTPKTFFRDVPSKLLQQYFSEKGFLEDLEFEAPKKTRKSLVEAIYQAWLMLPDEVRGNMEQDFQEIHEMASESGIKIILDEATWHDENLAEFFSKMESFHERVFWTFLEKKQYWEKVSILNRIEKISDRSWKKHNNLPQKPANVLSEAIKNLGLDLADFFHKTHGKGKNCEVIPLRRGEIDYFIAYPEDYTQASMEWEKGNLTNRIHRPAFETIFAFHQEQGTLEIYCTNNDKKTIQALQNIFAKIILGINLEGYKQKTDQFKYDLSCLKKSSFQFQHDSIKSGIRSVAIHKMILSFPSYGRKIALYSDVLAANRLVRFGSK